MINFYNISPLSKLSHFVKSFWAVEGDGAAEFIHRSVALGLSYIVFHYKGNFDEVKDNERFKYPLTHIQGQTQRFRLFSTKEPFGIFGVNFYPYVTPLLFRVSSDAITDQVNDLESLLGAGAKELEEKIMYAPNNLERIKIISSYLEKRLFNESTHKDHAIQEAIKHVINSNQVETVAQLAYRFNLSKRQFERKFKEYSGFSPKLFFRIVRFQKAYALCENKPQSLLEVAFACGYYDQAHFNHDFKMFSGFQPTEIIKLTEKERKANG